MKRRPAFLTVLALLFCITSYGQTIAGDGDHLRRAQQKFVDLRFGMFIHFNIPTFINEDWADPDASPSIFNPTSLDCRQWADAAASADMSYGCLTTKHHSGFCIWNTKTTDYNVMNSPYGKDVVKEYADAFRSKGLKVMLYYSILDTHHKLRPGFITPKHIEMVKAQLTELLTNYGEVTALIIDGWDAPWSRISYDDIPFAEVYALVKSLQPDCLLMDLNAAKYPAEGLFYTDIKSYEQGAGQKISKETNQLPALSCLPINQSWFWKTNFPSVPVKAASTLVNENVVPLNNVHCNFILNVSPNRAGLLDDNTRKTLSEIGKLWKNSGPLSPLKAADAPIVSSNIAKHKKANGSWSDDMWIMDFGNDDDFSTAWRSNKAVKQPWYEVDFGEPRSFNMITITEDAANVKGYAVQYLSNDKWNPIATENNPARVKIHRFATVTGSRVRILMTDFSVPPAIAELGVYMENR